jgi:uncharacterized RDD family membrane protein YckC
MADTYEPESTSDPAESPGKRRRLFPGDLLLGSVLVASDAVREWIETNAPSESEALAEEARPVLLPESEWEDAFGRPDRDRARDAAIGLVITAGSRLGRTGKVFIRAGDAATSFVTRPLQRSRILSPARRGFNRLTEAGEAQLDRWAATGRDREMRSRALAKATLGRAADDSVKLVAEEPHIQVIVQEIVAGQGMGMTEQAIEEVRKRAIALDLRSEKIVRGILRRAPRESLPGPGFTVAVTPNPRDATRLAGTPHLGGQYAGFVSRLMAFVIDLFVILLVLAVTWLLVTAFQQVFHVGSLLSAIFGITPHPSSGEVIASVFVSLLAMGYWVLGWAFAGQSIGKVIMGVRIVGPGGSELTFWRSLRRIVGYLVVVVSLGLGFLWVLVDNRRQGWDDKIAGTFVVYNWEARPDQAFLTQLPKRG